MKSHATRGAASSARSKEPQAGRSVFLKLDVIEPNPDQPRKTLDRRQLDELISSIQAVGLLHPIVVREVDGEQYQIIAGERRYRAFLELAEDDPRFSTIPATIIEADDEMVCKAALVENLARHDLNPIERAQAFQELRRVLKARSYEDVAAEVGLSKRSVQHYVGLLKLKKEYQEAIESKQLTEKHGRALRKLAKHDGQAVDLFEYLLRKEEVTGDAALSIASAMSKRGLTAEEAHTYLQDDTVSLPAMRTGPTATPTLQALRGLKTFLRAVDDLKTDRMTAEQRQELLEVVAAAEEALSAVRTEWKPASVEDDPSE